MPRKKQTTFAKTYVYHGHQYRVKGATKKEAEAKLRKLIAELEAGEYRKSKELTLDQYHEIWEDSRHGTVSENTIRKQKFEYANISNTTIDRNGNRFGDLIMKDIEVQHCRILQSNLAKLKRKDKNPNCSEPEKSLHNSNCINSMMALLSHILNDAMAEQIITYNPCKAVKPLRRKESEPEARTTYHRALSVKETEAFLNEAKDTWYYNAYVFMLNSGVRCGELGALKRSDIDEANGVIHISRTITRTETGAHIVGTSTKTRTSKRDIPLTPELKKAIDNQIRLNKINNRDDGKIIDITPKDENKDDSFLQKKKNDLDELIFKSSENSLLNDTVINRDIKRKCIKAGIERFSAHAFRDTFATRAIENGMNPNTLKEILGHTSLSMTMDLYAHVMPETKVNEMNLIKVVNDFNM